MEDAVEIANDIQERRGVPLERRYDCMVIDLLLPIGDRPEALFARPVPVASEEFHAVAVAYADDCWFVAMYAY